MKGKKIYLFIAVCCFIICVLIALFLNNHNFLRGFSGDIFVAILIYYSIKMFFKISPLKLGIIVLIFSYTIEFLQYFNFVYLIGLGENKLARIIFGNTFDFMDLFAYAIGVYIAYFLDTKLK